jgi:hypothetical protein
MKLKLTPNMLRQIVREEKAKIDSEILKDGDVDVHVFDADELADSVGKPVDYVKVLKVEQARLEKRLTRVKQLKEAAIKKSLKGI